MRTDETRSRPAILRLLPSASGLLVLVVLLASLPWLPLQSSQDSMRSRVASQRFTQTAQAPTPAFGKEGAFTIHLVTSPGDVTPLRARFPNTTLNVIIPARLDDEGSLGEMRRTLKEDPASLQSARIIDYRCNPMPPPSQLCDLP